MNIRKLRDDDYDALYALWLSCKGMGLNSVDDSREGYLRFLRRNPGTCFAAVDDGGALIGSILAGNDGRRGYIHHTAVSPEMRSQGIGRALVSAALDALRSEDISKVTLVVFERNAVGNAFWESLGFHAREDLVYRDVPLIEMERIET